MIINPDIHPQKQLYYLGAKLIDIINISKRDTFVSLDLFNELNKQEKVSINLFMLTLDWLYLLDLIDFNDGLVRKCF